MNCPGESSMWLRFWIPTCIVTWIIVIDIDDISIDTRPKCLNQHIWWTCILYPWCSNKIKVAFPTAMQAKCVAMLPCGFAKYRKALCVLLFHGIIFIQKFCHYSTDTKMQSIARELTNHEWLLYTHHSIRGHAKSLEYHCLVYAHQLSDGRRYSSPVCISPSSAWRCLARSNICRTRSARSSSVSATISLPWLSVLAIFVGMFAPKSAAN